MEGWKDRKRERERGRGGEGEGGGAGRVGGWVGGWVGGRRGGTEGESRAAGGRERQRLGHGRMGRPYEAAKLWGINLQLFSDLLPLFLANFLEDVLCSSKTALPLRSPPRTCIELKKHRQM